MTRGQSPGFRIDFDSPTAGRPNSPAEAKKRAAVEAKARRDARLAKIRAQRTKGEQ